MLASIGKEEGIGSSIRLCSEAIGNQVAKRGLDDKDVRVGSKQQTNIDSICS